MTKKRELYIAFNASITNKKKILLYTARLRAGFTSAIDTYSVTPVNLNKLLVGYRKKSTLYVPVKSKDMESEHIHMGDLAVIDESVKQPKSGAVILCALDNQPMIRQLKYNTDRSQCWLQSSDEDTHKIYITSNDDFVIHGLVTYSVTSHTLKREVWDVSATGSLDIHDLLVTQPSSTFFGIIEGESMKDALVYDGDLAVVDKLFEYQNGQKILTCVDDEFTVKYLELDKEDKNVLWLMPANHKFPPIKVTNESHLLLWGQIKYTITPFNGRKF